MHVLVVPYFSRFMRNVKQALIFRDEMHARGAVVYVCDERILSSDERGWDEWVREAHEAEAFSRSSRVVWARPAKRSVAGTGCLVVTVPRSATSCAPHVDAA